MFTAEEIKEIAGSSKTAQTVFDALLKRKRFRRKTNLSKFAQLLMSEGQSIVEDDFIETFKKLEEKGVGVLIVGRKGNPNRFKWNYNLKGVAQAVKGEVNTSSLGLPPKAPTKSVDDNQVIVKRGPGRPRKIHTVTKTQGTIKITFEMSANDHKEIVALMSLIDGLKAKVA